MTISWEEKIFEEFLSLYLNCLFNNFSPQFLKDFLRCKYWNSCYISGQQRSSVPLWRCEKGEKSQLINRRLKWISIALQTAQRFHLKIRERTEAFTRRLRLLTERPNEVNLGTKSCVVLICVWISLMFALFSPFFLVFCVFCWVIAVCNLGFWKTWFGG